jgi:hypothetical protein
MQKPKILAFSGSIGAGKDTAGNFIKNIHPEYEMFAFALNVKKVVAILTETTMEENLDRQKSKRFIPAFNATLGELHQKVGNGMRAAVGVNVWIDSVLSDPAKYKIITDVRFPDEVKAIEDAGGMVIRIERPEEHKIEHDVNFELANDKRPRDDISETALNGYKFKYVIRNDSTLAAFKEKILALLYVICM